jgi:hypothetical protein
MDIINCWCLETNKSMLIHAYQMDRTQKIVARHLWAPPNTYYCVFVCKWMEYDSAAGVGQVVPLTQNALTHLFHRNNIWINLAGILTSLSTLAWASSTGVPHTLVNLFRPFLTFKTSCRPHTFQDGMSCLHPGWKCCLVCYILKIVNTGSKHKDRTAWLALSTHLFSFLLVTLFTLYDFVIKCFNLLSFSLLNSSLKFKQIIFL